MPSSAPFDFIDHPYAIEHIARTKASISGGTVTPPSDSTTSISGNFIDENIERENRRDGIEFRGDAALFTETDMDTGDFVDVWHSDKSSNPNDFTRFRIKDKRRHGVIEKHFGITRIRYDLEKKDVGED